MVPTSSISKMFDIIRNEDLLSSNSTDEVKEMLYFLQNGDLTRFSDSKGSFLSIMLPGVINPVVNHLDMEKIIRLEDALIKELRERGEVPPTKKFS